MGEMPQAEVPHFARVWRRAEPGAPGPDDDLHGPAMKAGGCRVAAGTRGQQRGLGEVFEDHKRVAEVDGPPSGPFSAGERREHVQRLIDHHASRHIEERTAGPDRGMKGGELVGHGIDNVGLEKVRAEQVAVLGHELDRAAEQARPRSRHFASSRDANGWLSNATVCPARATFSAKRARGSVEDSPRRTGYSCLSRSCPSASLLAVFCGGPRCLPSRNSAEGRE